MKHDRLLIDGYNVLGQMKLENLSLEDMRDVLCDHVADYAGYTGKHCTLVFDGYNVPGGKGSEYEHAGITVVFTKQDETADVYIERLTTLLVKAGREVTVATGDAVEQGIILGLGAYRMSAREFIRELNDTQKQRRREHPGQRKKSYLFHSIDDDTLKRLEELRQE